MLKIIAYLGWDAKQHKGLYKVLCLNCRNESTVRSDQLNYYGTKGCPCCKRTINTKLKEKDDLTGRIVNGYEVIALLPQRDKNRRRLWLCRCVDCGTKRVFNQYDIKNERMKICECARRRAFLKGKMEVSCEMLDSL